LPRKNGSFGSSGGYSLEGTIPDGLAGEIIRNTIMPHFREGRFAEGIEAGVAQIVETIARHKQIRIPAPEPRLRTTASERGSRVVHLTLH